MSHTIVVNIPLRMLESHPDNPRRSFPEGELRELVESIKEFGILSHLVVVRVPGAGRSRVVCGERRFRAAAMAGLEDVPCIVKELTETEQLEVMIVENVQRRELDPVEEANCFKKLMDLGQSQADIAKKVGKSQEYVSNRIRLLRLPQDVQADISRGILPATAARELLRLEDFPKELARQAESLRQRQASVESIAHSVGYALREATRKLEPGDEGWPKPDFDTTGCASCGRTVVLDGHKRCKNVSCWGKKQAEAQRAAAQRAIEASGGLPRLQDLEYGTYAEMLASECDLSACGGCADRKSALLANTEIVPICMRPDCYRGKQGQVRREREEARARDLERVVTETARRILPGGALGKDHLVFVAAAVMSSDHRLRDWGARRLGLTTTEADRAWRGPTGLRDMLTTWQEADLAGLVVELCCRILYDSYPGWEHRSFPGVEVPVSPWYSSQANDEGEPNHEDDQPDVEEETSEDGGPGPATGTEG